VHFVQFDIESLSEGSLVRVRKVSPDEAKRLQLSEEGKWEDGVPDKFLGRVGTIRSIGNDGLYSVSIDGMVSQWVQSLIEAATSTVSFFVGGRVYTRSVTNEEGRDLMLRGKLRWDDDFPGMLGLPGVVVHDKDGELRLEVGCTVAHWPPTLIELTQSSKFSVGDRVRIKNVTVAEAEKLMKTSKCSWVDR
jgi:hypothetical protein